VSDTPGASHVNSFRPVPATCEIVTCAADEEILSEVETQLSTVFEYHAAVLHEALETRSVAVKSSVPKCNPLNVTDAPPETGAFVYKLVTVGPSKLKTPPAALPMTVEMVIWVAAEVEEIGPIAQMIDVAEFHCDDLQPAPPNRTDGVKSINPKLRPSTDTTIPPVCGLFSPAEDATGVSNVKLLMLVPKTV
jgi:hypothetical protein